MMKGGNVVLEIVFDYDALKYDYIEIYRDDEDFDEEDCENQMWAEIESMFDEVDEFVIKHLKKDKLKLDVEGDAKGKRVYGLSQEECKKLLEHKNELLGSYIVEVNCV